MRPSIPQLEFRRHVHSAFALFLLLESKAWGGNVPSLIDTEIGQKNKWGELCIFERKVTYFAVSFLGFLWNGNTFH